MRIPATFMTDHLMWTRSGVVWAMWRLKALDGGFGTRRMKTANKLHHQALFQGQRGESLLLGLCADLDPVSIVERMLEGVRIDECPDWADEVELTLDALEQVPLGTRAFWLAVPLAAGSWKARSMAMLRAGDAKVRDIASLPKVAPSASEVEAMQRAAHEIEVKIPRVFEPSRATAAEHVWIALHSQQRGLSADRTAPLPAPSTSTEQFIGTDMLPFQLPAAMPNPWIDEGGQSDVTNRAEQFLPFKRKYLKIQSPYAEDASYQVTQVLVGSPKNGWESPGVEWLSFVDQLPVDVDWAMRLTTTSAAEVKKQNKKSENKLKDQVKQQDGDDSITGGTVDLADDAAALAAYQASLNSSEREVGVQATVMFAVGDDTAEGAKSKARFLYDSYKASDFLLEAPLGQQEDLWWAMLPGVETTRVVREHAQLTTGRELATGVPLLTSELGDVRGARFGVNITTGRHGQILRDMAGNNKAAASASFGVVAEKGAGKSALLKCEAGDTVDRGGRIIAFDRTEAQEYAKFALSLRPDQTAIASLLNPQYNLDPLRVFGPVVGARMLQSLFAVMLGLPVLSTGGAFLSSLLEGSYLKEKNITSARALRDHLANDLSSSAESSQLLGLMNIVANKDIGEVIFNDGLPALDHNMTAIAFLTAGLPLPDRTELENAHLFQELTLEKRFGRAMYTMLTAATRTICFMDRSQLAGAIFDECHAITSSPEGARELKIFFRDDRKHNAFAAVGSHDPADFGDEESRALIKTRFVMRQTDEKLAPRALDWLAKGLGDDEDAVHTVMKDLSPMDPATGEVPAHRRGEGIMRDVSGRIGKFQKTLPLREHRREAVLSDPGEEVLAA